MSADKGYLVRGIDPIPENWEGASCHRALRSLRRSATVLERLVAEALTAGHKARARELRGVLTAVNRGLAHISGAFVISEIKPLASERARLEREAERWCARQRRRARPALQLVVDNAGRQS